MNSDVAVRARHLDVVRGGRRVLRDVAFDIRQGTVTGLLGPSGSGKTTLLRAVVGIQANVTGRLQVLDRPAGDPSLRSSVAYVTQAPSVYADLTVAENLRYFARVLNASPEAIGRAVETVGLSRHADQAVSTLSGGERSRVSLATALLARPRLLILDEPTVGLDPLLREELWTTFRRLAASGATLLVSSHVMDEADRCDRVLVLRDGDLIADDTPAGIRERSRRERLDDAFIALVEQQA